MPITQGTRLGRYQVLSTLGAGGMGEVYLAQDTQLDRTVALKILHASVARDQQRMRRFIQEARAASALNHPNIITIYEIGQSDDIQFISTEYVEGVTLREHAKRAQLKIGEVLDIVIQIAGALAAAHAAGIVHRDIKPENIMLRRDGYVKVLDFGLAKLAEKQSLPKASDSGLETLLNTQPGAVMGTARYMSPEQARGLDVDARTDIFSLGIVLYEMLAGRPPFEGPTAADLFVSILEKDPPPLGARSREGDVELEWMVQKALRKRMEERYQTIEEMLNDLRRLKRWLEFEAELEYSVQAKLADAATTIARQQQTVELSKETVKESSISSLGPVASQPDRKRRSRKAINSLAVLPLVNASPDTHAEYLSDGITETLINSLSHIPKLRVIARATVFRYKGLEVDPQQVGRELNVRAIVMGRVLQRGDRLNIQTELVDAEDGSQLWGEQYDRAFSDILTLQDEISRELSEKLRLRLTTNEKKRLAKRYTENSEAYQCYLRGRYHWNKRTEEGINKAVEYFKQAIAKDASYALGYAGLADCYILLGYYGSLSPKETMPKAKEAALKAVEIDDTLSESHVSLAKVKETYDWDWTGAERDYLRAIELNPQYATAHHWYAVSLMMMGRHTEAITEIRRAQGLDPLSLPINKDMGWAFYFARQYDEAIEQVHKTIEIDPNFVRAHILLGLVYKQRGMYAEAIAEFEKVTRLHGGNTSIVAEFGCTYAAAGRRDEALHSLEELKESAKEKYVSPYDIATIYTALGETDEAFNWLERAYEERSSLLIYLKVEPSFDPLRSDPRFTDLLRRVGLAS